MLSDPNAKLTSWKKKSQSTRAFSAKYPLQGCLGATADRGLKTAFTLRWLPINHRAHIDKNVTSSIKLPCMFVDGWHWEQEDRMSDRISSSIFVCSFKHGCPMVSLQLESSPAGSSSTPHHSWTWHWECGKQNQSDSFFLSSVCTYTVMFLQPNVVKVQEFNLKHVHDGICTWDSIKHSGTAMSHLCLFYLTLLWHRVIAVSLKKKKKKIV